MTEWTGFNINNHVKVKLTAEGHKALADSHVKLYGALAFKYPFRKVQEDEDGFSTWQLWELMAQLGPHISIGIQNPLDPLIFIETDNQNKGGK